MYIYIMSIVISCNIVINMMFSVIIILYQSHTIDIGYITIVLIYMSIAVTDDTNFIPPGGVRSQMSPRRLAWRPEILGQG